MVITIKPLVSFALGALFGSIALALISVRTQGWPSAEARSGAVVVAAKQREPRIKEAPVAAAPSVALAAAPMPTLAVEEPEATLPDPAPFAPEPPQLPNAFLAIPVFGITVADLTDQFDDARGEGRGHEAIDISAPRGTPVMAVDAGAIAKLFTSVRGGLTVYQFDSTGTLAYYYAHLDRYAENLVEGQSVARGEVIGYVGSTGNADPQVPHLHFAIFALGPEKLWWKGTALNPYPRFGGQ